MYDYVIITHLPAFYKVNLYNEISKKLKIYVIFIANNTNEKRSADFVNIDNMNFESEFLNDGDFQSRNKIGSIITLYKALKKIRYKKLLISGWDLPEFWYAAFMSAKKTNCLALESTVMESNIKGIKGFVKKVFLSRISTVFASGELHVRLLKELNYSGNIKITKGVGIINKIFINSKIKTYQKKFLFIGRLSSEKNLLPLIEMFNDLPDFMLTIVGDGPQREELHTIARNNVIFLNQIENKELETIFFQNNILILPSISEAWGLVIEEALYFGLPVIVSKNCGACELIENNMNGFIVNPYDLEALNKIISSLDTDSYNRLLKGVEEFSIEDKDNKQVSAYII